MPGGGVQPAAGNRVSVPFDAGRGLMQGAGVVGVFEAGRFSTLRCGSWIDARTWVPGPVLDFLFQYPSMRVVD